MDAMVSNGTTQAIVLTTSFGTLLLVPISLIGIDIYKEKQIGQNPTVRTAVKSIVSKSKSPNVQDLTGKASHNFVSVGISMFASYMGCWVITGPVEVGYLTGSWGVVLYTCACFVPLLFFILLGPRMRKVSSLKGFSMVDFASDSYGKFVRFVLSIIAFIILFFATIADFTGIYGLLSEVAEDISTAWIIADMVILAACCTGYSLLGGFAASLYTDVVQAVLLIVLTMLLAGLLIPLNGSASSESRAIATEWNMTGVIAGLVLNVSVFLVTFADQGFWQKFYAAKDDRTYALASLVCCALYIPVIAIFGYLGCVARALTLDKLIEEVEYPGNSIFQLLQFYGSEWASALVILIGTLCVMSSVDNRILAIGNLIGQDLINQKWNLNITRVLGFVSAVGAIIIAIFQPASIMQVLYCGNLFGCISSPPLLLSVWKRTTRLSIILSIVFTCLTPCIFGWAYLGTFVGGFEWWYFPLGYYEVSCLWTYLATIAVSFGTIVVVSLLTPYQEPTIITYSATKELSLQVPTKEDLENEELQTSDSSLSYESFL